VSPLGNESVILSPYILKKLNENLRNLFKALMEDILKEQNNTLLWKFCAPWAINPLMWETLKMAVCACHSYEAIMVQNYSNFDFRSLNHDCFKQVSQNINIFVVVCFWKGTISFGKIRQTLWNRFWWWM